MYVRSLRLNTGVKETWGKTPGVLALYLVQSTQSIHIDNLK